MPVTRHIRSRRLLLLALILAFFVAPFTLIHAQGNTLTYGSSTAGSITDQNRLILYSFNGNAGDVVTAYAIGVTAGLDPSISLLSPGQQPLANNDNDAFGGAGGTTAR